MPARKLVEGPRGGRFRTNTTIPLVFGREGARYRIFNTGDAPFDVTTANNAMGNPILVSILNGCSIDLLIKDAAIGLKVVPSGNAEGVYEIIQPDAEIRPGRLKVRQASAATEQLVISMLPQVNTTTTPKALYRFFNAGKNEFKVIMRTAATAVEHSLGADQSIDFEVPGTGAHRTVSVLGLAGGGGGMPKPYEASYEHLRDVP
ncbi:hypothetical protein [Planctomyces sp. SH-PL14]|uniref:hypothetical protein n=1 Tax=Planctomyces sp. SH-PL14 TaxID=1632864 RepID=UPI00078BEAAE|nr:hypothetical protein [Planctomyces sp. SH-PL14]AMV18837.1 hypothetical protein VT03_13185 [Planctomyces sp. SH-PL14]